jgi:uncharacterized repeat protein (TIGR01451 family)
MPGRQIIVGTSLLLLTLASSSAVAMTVTKTVDPPGLVSIDGCGRYCDTLPPVSFDATDFGAASEITDVDVSITWFKTDRSCNTPSDGNAFHGETNFRLDGPRGRNVVLASPGTWSGQDSINTVTTDFDQAAAAVPSGTPVSGTFRPNNGNLDNFNGLSGTATWELRAGDNGSGDPLCVDSYSVTVTAVPVIADLSITKTDGVSTAAPGGTAIYTIVASNAGPAAALGNTVTDTFPAACSAVSWTCVGAGGGTCSAAGGGNISDTVDLPAGGSATYTASCDIAPTATGTLSNTAIITPSPSVIDPDSGNNNATDNDTLVATADLSITKTDGVSTATPGGSVAYTIVASNAGPSVALGNTVTDTFPAACTVVTWTCVGAGGGSCSASGSGDISDSVDLPVGGSATYTATCDIDPSVNGILDNTVSISPAAGVSDPDSGNNSASDTDTLVAVADLAITKTDGVSSAAPGDTVTYTIVASNAGPSAATGNTVTDTFPAACTAVSWTCVGAGGGSCAASGSGDISDSVDLAVGGNATYTATCDIDPAATGTLDNTATVAPDGSVSDPNNGNNSATDSDTLTATADLSITKTDGVSTATPGGAVTYTIAASNAGPSAAIGNTVTDTFPAACTAVSWTCVGAGGGSCSASGSGDIADTVDLPAGGSATYTATCDIDPAATGTLDNTASVAPAIGLSDPDNTNNSASDTDSLLASADLSISKVAQAVPDPIVAGSTFNYLLTVSNSGPSTASDVLVEDNLPANLDYVSNDCGASFVDPLVSWSIGSLASAGTESCIITVTVTESGAIENTATVSSSTDDPTPANDSASAMLGGAELADVAIELNTNLANSPIVGSTFAYLVTVTNNGPGVASNLDISLMLSPAVAYIADTCGGFLVGDTLNWSVASVASGAVFNCQVDVLAAVPMQADTSAQVATESFDPDLSNNTTALQTIIGALAVPALSPLGLLLMMLLLGLVAVRRLA